MLQRYPAVGLLTAWAILVGVAIAATTAIMNPEASIDLKASTRTGSTGAPALPPLASSPAEPLPPEISPPELSPTIEPTAPESRNRVAPAARSRPPVSHSPAAAVSIILISCSAGCLFLSRCLKPRSTPASRRPDLVGRPQPQPVQPSPPSTAFAPVLIPAPLAPAAPEPAPDLTFEFSLPEQLEAPVYNGPLLRADETDSEPLDPEASDAANAVSPDVIATVVPIVVPDAQDHPLDWVESSLADSLDLRQRRPLSYWLGGLG